MKQASDIHSQKRVIAVHKEQFKLLHSIKLTLEYI